MVIDIKDIMGLDSNKRRKLVDSVLRLRSALLVTEPSIVYIRYLSSSLALSVGTGSLILPPEASILNIIKHYEVFRREWINGCWIRGEPRYIYLDNDERNIVNGVARALTLKDPVAFLSNGIKGIHEVASVNANDLVPLVVIEEVPVVFKDLKGGYVISVIDGPLKDTLEYIVPLASACRSSP